MKALIINEPGKVATIEKEIPELKRGEVLLQNRYIGFCGSDLSTYRGKNPMVTYPRIPGHEISATIQKIGPEVPEGFKVGDHVTVLPYTNCGQCAACRRGRENACQFNQTFGVQRDGAMQEFLSVPWQKLIMAPGLKPLEMAMIEPLTIGFHAVERGRVTDSDVVAVMGCGMIGVGAIIRSVLRGAEVIAIDIDDYKLNLAKKLGVQYVINTSEGSLKEELDKITGRDGPDVIFEAAGNPITYRAAIDNAAFTARVVCIGYAASEIAFATKYFVQKELDIMGSRNATPADFRAVVKYMKSGNFPVDELITRTVGFEDAASGLEEWAANPGRVMKIVLEMGDE